MDHAVDKAHSNLMSHPLLDKNEERNLLRGVAQAPTKKQRDRAAHQLAACNMRLVDSVARKYLPPGTMTHQDLFDAGCEGLSRAIQKFDLDKDVRFSTYATYWIQQSITRELENSSRPIRVPAHLHQKIARALRASNTLSLATGHNPTATELAGHLGVPVEEVDSYYKVRARCSETRSLQSQITEDGRELQDTIPDQETCAEDLLPALFDERTADALLLQQAVEALPETQRHIIRARYGLDGEKPKSLREVSEELGISSERVRQRQLTAIDELYRNLVAAKSRERPPGHLANW